MSKYIWVALCATISTPAFSQTVVDNVFENDPEQKSLKAKIETEREKAKGTFVMPPLQVSYGFFVLPIETRLGPQRHQVQASQALPWWGQSSARDDYFTARAAAISPKLDLRKRTIRRDIVSVQIDVAQAREELVVERKHKVLLDGLLRSTQSLVEIGRAKKSDLTRLAFEIAKTSDMLQRKNAEIEIRSAALAEFGVEDVESLTELSSFSTLGAISKHPNVRGLELEADVVEAAKTRLDLSNKPTFVVGATYTEVGAGDLNTDDAGKDALKVMVGVKLPVWGTPKKKEIESLEAKKIALQFEAEAIIRKLEADVKVLEIRRTEIERRLKFISSTSLPIAGSAQQDTTLDYEVAKATITDVLRAIDVVHVLELEQISLRYERDRVRNNLEFLLGGTP